MDGKAMTGEGLAQIAARWRMRQMQGETFDTDTHTVYIFILPADDFL